VIPCEQFDVAVAAGRGHLCRCRIRRVRILPGGLELRGEGGRAGSPALARPANRHLAPRRRRKPSL